jgi:hypothetical protein
MALVLFVFVSRLLLRARYATSALGPRGIKLRSRKR